MNSIERNLLVSRAILRKLIGLGFDIRNIVNLNGFTGILYSQAFDWFRVEHGLHNSITLDNIQNIVSYDVLISDVNNFVIGLNDGRVFNMFDFNTYESARLACLEKLIELVTDKKK